MRISLRITLSVSVILIVGFGVAPTALAQEFLPRPEGVDAVLSAQKEPPKYEPEMTASEQIEAYMGRKGWFDGWDDDKKRFFVSKFEAFNTRDPRYDNDFMLKREIKAKEAVIGAKVDVIEFINVEMSAEEKIHTPGTDVHDKLNEKWEGARRQLLAQKAEVAKLLQQVDAAEAAHLEGVTAMDRLPALMDAIIKKLDESYDSGEIEADKRARFDETKASYAEAVATLAQLKEEAAALDGEVQKEFSSKTETVASMPLFGNTVVAQAESYSAETKQYEIAILFVWSAALEEAARATLLGTAMSSGANAKKKSLQEWLAKQDLSVMVGPRQYLDDQGRRFFIGISARPQGTNASISSKNRRLADLNAKAMAAFSLRADVDAHSKASQASKETSSGTLGEGSTLDVAESLAQTLSQSIKANMRGLGKVAGKRVKHPISGQEIYVSVFGITPDAAQAALEAEVRSYATAVEVNKKMQLERGRKDGMQAEAEAARTDEASYRAGAATGKADVREEVGSRKSAAAGTPTATASKAEAAPPVTGESVEGSFMSGDDVEDDF